ncbi:MAG: SAM-dependent methyltransferase [Rhodomicrobiaceae bacterium]
MAYLFTQREFRFSLSKAVTLSTMLVAASAVPSFAQDKPKLDVPYVPTPTSVVERMLELAEVKDGDYVLDLGSGDGRIAIAAAKRGATAMGVDIDPARVTEARENAKRERVDDRVTFEEQDLFDTDFSKADVLTLYLLHSVNMKIRPKILSDLKPGTRVVSHAFSMGDWEADHHEKVQGRDVYFWIVPAQVDGQWQVKNGDQDIAVTFEQSFQNLSGTATIDGKEVPIEDGKIRGDRVTFTIDDGSGKPGTLSGRIEDGRITPEEQQSGSVDKWEANRAS